MARRVDDGALEDGHGPQSPTRRRSGRPRRPPRRRAAGRRAGPGRLDQLDAEGAEEGGVAGGADDGADALAAGDQRLGDVAAEQPGRAGDDVALTLTNGPRRRDVCMGLSDRGEPARASSSPGLPRKTRRTAALTLAVAARRDMILPPHGDRPHQRVAVSDNGMSPSDKGRSATNGDVRRRGRNGHDGADRPP